MTKQKRIDGFLAEYKILCEKFDVFVMSCHLCKELVLMPANLIIGGPSVLVDLIKTHTENHHAPFQWIHFHAPKEPNGKELSSPQIQNDQAPSEEYNTSRE